MENEFIDDYDYYLYVYKNRIVRVVKTRKKYNAVTYKGLTSYSKSFIPEGISTEELLYNYNYNVSEGYQLVASKEEDNLSSFMKMTAIIKILERFQLLVSYLKSSIISRALGEDIYNKLLMQQIEIYQKDSRNVGSLLEAELKCSKYESYEALIEAIKLKYADASEMLAYIRYQEYEVKKLLKNNNFKEVENIIIDMQQKLKI
jgi:hypothetical protein